MTPRIVMSGVDSEYVLSGLAQYLRLKGYEVFEFDFGQIRSCVRSELSKLSQEKTVYITSAHTALSVRTARRAAPMFANLYPNYLAPIEILPLLKPDSSIFVPHDLLTPFGDTNLSELQYLDLYDHVLTPYLTEEVLAAAGSSCQVHEAGWIKYIAQPLLPTPIPLVGAKPRVSLFLTIIQHMQYQYGVAGFVDYLRPILSPNINIKLPAWKGIEALESQIRNETEANVLPADISSVELIEASDVIICNSVSSILAEAILLGKPCICLLDAEGDTVSIKQKKMVNFPELRWHNYQERAPLTSDFISEVAGMSLPKRLKPFDFQRVEAIVQGV